MPRVHHPVSEKLYKEALQLFPGGVNSPVRAFRSVGGTPLFIKRGKGCYIWDEDRNRYIDFCASWGPLILGHAAPAVLKEIRETIRDGLTFGACTRRENDLARLIIDHIPFVEKIRFVSSGTEAVMSAVRLARAFTRRNIVVKFEGCYHGHADYMLVKAGSGLATFGVSSSAGVSESFTRETIVLPLGDTEALGRAFAEYGKDIACVIIEPVPANHGLLVQRKEFLKALRNTCSGHGSLLIFDEVITGFRLGFGGAAAFYGIRPDLVTYGKIIGGGMPVGAYGGRDDVMSMVSPDGPVYQAGTLSGNPVAMAAGHSQLKACLKKGFYEKLEQNTGFLAGSVNRHAALKGYPVRLHSLASIFWVSFSGEDPPVSAKSVTAGSMKAFPVFYQALLSEGVYLGPSGYEVGFVSAAHTRKALQYAARAFAKALDATFSS